VRYAAARKRLGFYFDVVAQGEGAHIVGPAVLILQVPQLHARIQIQAVVLNRQNLADLHEQDAHALQLLRELSAPVLAGHEPEPKSKHEKDEGRPLHNAHLQSRVQNKYSKQSA
jgi:hypothetical protein